MYKNTKKYQLMKDLPEYPAGTIFIYDEEFGRWIPDKNTDILMQYNDSYIIEKHPDWFKPLTFEMEGVEHHSCCTSASHDLNIGDIGILKEMIEDYSKLKLVSQNGGSKT